MLRTPRIGLLLAALALAPWSAADFTLTVLHTNDLHAHAEPTTVRGKSYGGYARLATMLAKAKAADINPILLDAGDVFQGTLFFNVYVGLADLAFMNTVGYDAMAVGNHEFDRGPQALADFAKLAKFPILSANLDITAEPLLTGLVQPSTVIEVDGQRIGIVGATTEDLPDISSPGPNVKTLPVVPAVQKAVDALKAQGIDKIIVVTHCGYTVDIENVAQLSGVDMIVGGHSHSLLGDLVADGFPAPLGPYPTVAKNKDGDTALIVQGWEWVKVLGRIQVTFDDAGRVKSWTDGRPLLVDESIPDDKAVSALIAALKKPIADMMNREIGSTAVEIPRSEPGQGALADMIADAMLAATERAGSVVALMNQGGVRSAIDAGPITYGDAIAVQPFNNTLVVLDLTGAEIKQALESGKLLISRGSSFALAPDRPEGQRVSEVVIAGQPLDLAKVYRCTFNSFVAAGGDALTVVKNAQGKRTDTGLLDVDALIEFIQVRSPLNPKAEGRIRIVRG